jgi:hypothetical protein
LRVEHVQEALAATDIDALALRIDKHVVGIATNVRARDQGAVFHREHTQLCRRAEGRENVPGILVEHHREIAGADAHWPARRLLSGLAIDNGDRPRFW